MPRIGSPDKGFPSPSGGRTVAHVRVLAVTTLHDGVLGAVAPLGLAAAVETALVIDLDPSGPPYPSRKSLADLVVDGPRREDLVPTRRGLAVLRNGGIGWDAAAELVEALARSWPAVVLRSPEPSPAFPNVPVVPLLPGVLAPRGSEPAVYQTTMVGERPPGPGPVLPRLCRPVVVRLLNGVVEPRSRWVRAWRQVWDWQWH